MSRTISKDKQAAGITWTGAWSGLAGGNEVQLENASNLGYASGTFGDNLGVGKPLANGSGAGKVNLKAGVDFTYNSKLNATGGSDVDIYDDNASGAFTASHYMRIVNNAKNITDVTGLNIQNIYAKQLNGVSSIWASPPSTDAYIDPEQGRFALPRPDHWSKCQSGGYGTPEIGNVSTSIVYTAPGYLISNMAGKFNNGVNMSATAGGAEYTTMRNTVDTTSFPSKGTVSFWAAVGVGCTYPYSFSLFGGSLYTYTQIIYYDGIHENCYPFAVGLWCQAYDGFNCHPRFAIRYGTTTIDSGVWFSRNTWYHIYVVWDSAKGLSGGKAIRAWINGGNEISSTNDIPAVGSNFPAFILATYGFDYANAQIDNPKYWDHVVSEDPAWEYNAGTGREDAMHYLYGAGNNYKPQITGVNNGVGYYYLATSGSPATSVGSGGDETETLKSSPTTNAAGSFGDSGALYTNTLAALNTTDHYNYNKRLDASVGEDPTDGFGAAAGGITDTGAAGALGVGKYIRLVANALNVKDANYPTAAYGGLKVFAKTIAGANKNLWTPVPPKDRMYVDPITGNWLMPRPTAWWKVDGGAFELSDPIYWPLFWQPGTRPQWEGFEPGLLGNCYRMYAHSPQYVDTFSGTYTIPHVGSLDWSKGTVSFWGKVWTQVVEFYQCSCDVGWAWIYALSGQDTYVQWSRLYDINVGGWWSGTGIRLVVNNVTVATWDPGDNVWCHFYIVWDTAKSLSGGKSIRVFINGVERLSTTLTLPTISNIQAFANTGVRNNSATGSGHVHSYLDNFKVWRGEIVSEDPAWEYNAGAGREDALHYIYGAANGYKPNLAAASSGTGYYRGGTSTRQCIISV